MKIKEIVSALDTFAPLPLQDGFDNAGVQVGLTEVEATGALLCLDVTEAVVDEAIVLGLNLIISHHPLIFRGYKSITGNDYVERCIIKAIKNDIVIFSMHTNIDNAIGGVNYKIAEKLGLQNIRILAPKEDNLLKLVTFVPTAEADKVRQALFKAGCGNIGNYDSCSFNTEGQGSFCAQNGANPFCGSIGALHNEPETRIETVLPAYKKNMVIKILLAIHPYEEPAYDLYPLKNNWKQSGAGIIGELPQENTAQDFLTNIKKCFQVSCLKYNKSSKESVRTVAICGGSGSFLLQNAIAQKADAFITGEIKYHEYYGHEDEILMIETGHYESEQYTTEIFYSIIKDLYPSLQVRTTKINTNPINYL